MASTLPRFFLPRAGAVWRTTGRACLRRCYASKPGGAKAKPTVLEKPEKFNPPSHGSKLPRGGSSSGPRHYGGPLSEMEVQAQIRKDYPGMPPPPNSFGHWFLNSPKIHAWISIGTLGSLAIYSLTRRFAENSPYGDMLPSSYEFIRHPILSIQATVSMVVLHMDYNTAKALESRRGSLEDITKRRKYRRAHNIEDDTFAKKILPAKFLESTDDAMDRQFGDKDNDKDNAKEEQETPDGKKGWGRF